MRINSFLNYQGKKLCFYYKLLFNNSNLVFYKKKSTRCTPIVIIVLQLLYTKNKIILIL